MLQLVNGVKILYDQRKSLRKQLRNLHLDGSSGFQLVMNLKFRNNDQNKYNILFRARFEKINGKYIAEVEDGIKELYVENGWVVLKIRGAGMI